MEILELIFASLDMCGCLLEVAAFFADIYAVGSGTRTARARKAARREGSTLPHFTVSFWLMLVVGLVLTAAVVWRWTR